MCGANLTCVDVDDTNGNITLGSTDLTIAETNITFTTQQLRQNRRYTVTVTASNAAGSATSEVQEIISELLFNIHHHRDYDLHMQVHMI